MDRRGRNVAASPYGCALIFTGQLPHLF